MINLNYNSPAYRLLLSKFRQENSNTLVVSKSTCEAIRRLLMEMLVAQYGMYPGKQMCYVVSDVGMYVALQTVKRALEMSEEKVDLMSLIRDYPFDVADLAWNLLFLTIQQLERRGIV